MARKKIRLHFESARFELRLYRASDYRSWKNAYEAMESKRSEFDLEKKTAKELRKTEFLRFVKKNVGFAKTGEIYHFGVFEKKTGRLMGFVLLALVLRFNVQTARISYTIFNNYWKHGYGREAADAAIRFAFQKLKLHRLEAEILPNNRSSLALAKRLGFSYEGLRRGAVYMKGKWHDHLVYSLLAEDRGVRNTKPSVFS
ncbi:MAG: GNAT family N-acetyltransferase [Bacteriovoracia bacterium]